MSLTILSGSTLHFECKRTGGIERKDYTALPFASYEYAETADGRSPISAEDFEQNISRDIMRVI